MYYYNARWYDAKLGRFAQADNIISSYSSGFSGYKKEMSFVTLSTSYSEGTLLKTLQEEIRFTQNNGPWSHLDTSKREKTRSPYGPVEIEALDRYSYVKNNPLIYSDPTGHEWESSGDSDLGYWYNTDTGEVWLYFNGEVLHYNLLDVSDPNIFSLIRNLMDAVEQYDRAVRDLPWAVVGLFSSVPVIPSLFIAKEIRSAIFDLTGFGNDIRDIRSVMNDLDSALETAEDIWPIISDPSVAGNTTAAMADSCQYRPPPVISW